MEDPRHALALARGLHVYAEKPLARTIAECDHLARLAGKLTKCVTQMGNQKIARPNHRRAEEILRRGLLGPVREVHGWTTRPHWPQGIGRPAGELPTPRELRWDDWLGPAAERSFDAAYHPDKWRGWRAFGTGALGDFGHDLFDAVWHGLELGMPAKVAAETSPAAAESPAARIVRRVVVTFRSDESKGSRAAGPARVPPARRVRLPGPAARRCRGGRRAGALSAGAEPV